MGRVCVVHRPRESGTTCITQQSVVALGQWNGEVGGLSTCVPFTEATLKRKERNGVVSWLAYVNSVEQWRVGTPDNTQQSVVALGLWKGKVGGLSTCVRFTEATLQRRRKSAVLFYDHQEKKRNGKGVVALD